MEQGGAKRLGGWGGFKVIVRGGQAITEGTNFYGSIYKYILLHSFYTLSICIVMPRMITCEHFYYQRIVQS